MHTILFDEGTSIIVSGGLEETALKVNSDKVTYIKELNSNQEESDPTLLLHAHYEANNGSGSVVIVSPDTDVLVLCVHHFDTLGIKNLHFKIGRKYMLIPKGTFMCTQFTTLSALIRETLCYKCIVSLAVTHVVPFMELGRNEHSTS